MDFKPLPTRRCVRGPAGCSITAASPSTARRRTTRSEPSSWRGSLITTIAKMAIRRPRRASPTSLPRIRFAIWEQPSSAAAHPDNSSTSPGWPWISRVIRTRAPSTSRTLMARRELKPSLPRAFLWRGATSPAPADPARSTLPILTIAVHATGRVYVAVSQRNANGDARVVLTMSTDGANTWSTPAPIDNGYVFDDSGNPFLNLSDHGHQIMPSMNFNAGKLTLIYYDLREDHTMGVFTPSSDASGYTETRQFLADLTSNVASVFTSFIDDSTLTVRRHTMDVQGAQADPLPAGQLTMPSFNTFRISKYFVGFDPVTNQAEQLTYNPPDLPLFVKGTEPFMGDYIDLAGDPPFILQGGQWQFNTSNTNPQVFHATWTDNRDVVQPPNGDWTQYVPPYSLSNPTVSHPSVFDPTQTVTQCVVGTNDQYLGTRNQNIYTARIEPALTINSPGNQKTLGYQPGSNTQLLLRAFSMYVRNATNAPLTIRLQTSQPAGGQASFQQFGGVTSTLDVVVAPLSTIARSVFAQSTIVTDSFTVQA